MKDLQVEEIVHLAFEAGREQMREEMCVEMGGHVEASDDASGQDEAYFDSKCARCGKRLKQ